MLTPTASLRPSAPARCRHLGTPGRRRVEIVITATVAMMAMGPLRSSADPVQTTALKIGVSLALTGPDARYGLPMLRGVELAVEETNRSGGAGGHRLETVVLDSAGPGEEGITRWRGMNNYERLIADPTVVAVVGPQTSGEARAVAPLLSRASLVTITPSATTFDITDPSLKERFRPGGQVVFFRTVGTDLAQGDVMADFAHERLGIHRIVLIDDGTDFGVRMMLAFARRAHALDMTILARKKVPWTDGDYRRQLHEASALNPEGLYFSGSYLVGVKLARQVAEVLPWVHHLATENLNDRAFPLQAGPGAEGWYVPSVAPDVGASPVAADWAERFRWRFGEAPSSYSLTAYTAATVIASAIGRVVRSGRPVTRATVRQAVGATRLPATLQGQVSFDANGDLEHPVVSIYQVRSGSWHYVRTTTVEGAPRDPKLLARP
jgi:branched-chain amino acid transport system substrate-binding protein